MAQTPLLLRPVLAGCLLTCGCCTGPAVQCGGGAAGCSFAGLSVGHTSQCSTIAAPVAGCSQHSAEQAGGPIKLSWGPVAAGGGTAPPGGICRCGCGISSQGSGRTAGQHGTCAVLRRCQSDLLQDVVALLWNDVVCVQQMVCVPLQWSNRALPAILMLCCEFCSYWVCCCMLLIIEPC